MLDQFINEIKIQLFIDHPNVVKLFGFFDDSTHFYIIMEYMEGGSLFNMIKKQKQLTEKDTAEKLKDICLGLKEMHDNSVLHRDIKPENIVLTNVFLVLFRMFVSFVILDGRPSAKIGETHTVALLIMSLLKLLEVKDMMIVLIFGASESWPTR